MAIVLAVLLAGGVVFSALFSALSEEALPRRDARNSCELTMEYLEDEQALHITQRLTYINPSEDPLNAVVFYAAGNMFRREGALMYGAAELEPVFFAGYAPAGIELRGVKCDGEMTDYGFQGEQEMYLRAACELEAGGQCEFEFDYYLLLMNCGAFQGAGDTDVRLSAFYFVPGVYDARYGEFILKKPLPYTRWLYCDAADFSVTLTLPEGFEVASTGEVTQRTPGDGRATWRMAARDVREFALSFGRRYRTFEGQTASGVRVRVLTNVRGAGARALDAAVSAVEQCEDWFGPFPTSEFEIAQSDYPLGVLNFPGLIWLSEGLFKGGQAETMAKRLRFGVAQQYFGLSAYVEPSADAWLSDAVSEYVSYLLLEAAEGEDRFLRAINRDWVSALQQTVPGGLTVTSDAALFDTASYGVVVLRRGAVVLHELRRAMGLEGLLSGLRRFHEMGTDGRTLTEMDLVAAMDAATGGSWEAFLTDWVFNVGDYTDQYIDWFD